MSRWNDRSQTSLQADTLELVGVLGSVHRDTKSGKERFRLFINWLSPEDDPPASSVIPKGLANSEGLLSRRFPSDRSSYILPIRSMNNHEIGFTAEVLEYPENADELGREFTDLITCRVTVVVKIDYYRFTPKPTPDNQKPTEVRGYRLRLNSLKAEGIEMEFYGKN